MDYRLPGIDGAEATTEILGECPGAAVVCLTAEANAEQQRAVLAAGAVALVEKARPVDELAAEIRRAAGGEAA